MQKRAYGEYVHEQIEVLQILESWKWENNNYGKRS